MENKSNRNIILKHRQGGMCLDPNTLVLTADLRWVKLADIKIGDELISVDEEAAISRGKSRHFRKTVVRGKLTMEAERYFIETDKGNIIATDQHGFLCKTAGGKNNNRWRKIDESKDRRKARLKVGSKIRMVVEPWGEPTFEDGWFGGMLDEEGSLALNRGQIKITQKAGAVMDRCKEYLKPYSTRYYTERGGYSHTPVDAIEIYGIADIMTILGKCRPTRFINRTDWWENRALNGKKIGVTYGTVLNITPLGIGTVMDIETSTHTYIANGFITHNTSCVLADMFVTALTVPHASCAVVSHETRATQRLLDRVHFYYDSMPDPKPKTGSESRTEITFPELHSNIYIGTAGARAFSRGDTIRSVLLSELPYYESPEKILVAIEDAVPLSGELTIEFTPYGEDNLGYELWRKAREGKSTYKPFFYPWWWTEDYQIPRGSEYALEQDRGVLEYTDEEKELIAKHKLTESQIRWRRWKLAEKGGMFWQEFPEDEVSCFIVVGDPVFDNSIITDLAQACYDGEKHSGGWTFWFPPKEGTRYTIGVDSSSGAPEGSYAAATCIDDSYNVCATFQARVNPVELAKIIHDMGMWYNEAKLVIERNFTGYSVIEQLKGYPNIANQRDFTTGRVTTLKGWWSNDQTRTLMMTIAKELLGKVKIYDINLVRQLRSYRYIKLKSKYREQAQTYDDLAISFMLALAERKTSGGVSMGYRGAVPGWSW